MLSPGDPVRCVMTKWGERPHWEYDGVYLGRDGYGDWVGAHAGTHHSRPGMAFDSDVDSVTLFPTAQWFCATAHRPGIWCHWYIDITTPPELADGTARAVDLDLDVIRMADPLPIGSAPDRMTAAPGEVFLDDEDEFAQHRIDYGYPTDVVEAAERAARELSAAVAERKPPFDDRTAQSWLSRLDDWRDA